MNDAYLLDDSGNPWVISNAATGDEVFRARIRCFPDILLMRELLENLNAQGATA